MEVGQAPGEARANCAPDLLATGPRTCDRFHDTEGKSMDDRTFTHAQERVRKALEAISSGDPQPYIDCWAEADDVTLFGAWGPIERGHP